MVWERAALLARERVAELQEPAVGAAQLEQERVKVLVQAREPEQGQMEAWAQG